MLRTTLEQWRAFQAVVDYGGYAQAAQALHRSQSSISYLVGRLQEQLGLPLLVVEGRKAQLTDAGRTLLLHAGELLADAQNLEKLAASLAQGWEPELRLVVDQAFPKVLLAQAMQRFQQLAAQTRVELIEVVLSGAEEAIVAQRADVMVGAYVPTGYLGSLLMDLEFVAVAHTAHPLHALGRAIDEDDLKRHRHIVVRDSGTLNPRDEGWLGSSQRWTVSSLQASIELIAGGLGFAWLPLHMVRPWLDSDVLRPLPLATGQRRRASLYLVLGGGRSMQAGPAAQLLARTLQEAVKTFTL